MSVKGDHDFSIFDILFNYLALCTDSTAIAEFMSLLLLQSFNIGDNYHSNYMSSLPPSLPPSFLLPFFILSFTPSYLFFTISIELFSRIVMCLSKKYLCMVAESRSESSFLDMSLFLKSSQELSATVGLQVQIVIELCNLLQYRIVLRSVVSYDTV